MADLEKQFLGSKIGRRLMPRCSHIWCILAIIFVWALWTQVTEINKRHKTQCSMSANVTCEGNRSCCSYRLLLSHTIDHDKFVMVTEEGECCESECNSMRYYLQQIKCYYNTDKPDRMYMEEYDVPLSTKYGITMALSLSLICAGILYCANMNTET